MSGKRRHDKSSARPERRLLMGRNSLRELLRSSPERIKNLYVQEQSAGSSGVRQELLALASQANCRIQYLDARALSDMVHSDSHQGFVAELQAFEYADFNQLIEEQLHQQQSLIVCLDGVLDPHNVGAILRSAECFGASAVLWSKNRNPGVTPVVSKVSVGASELLPIVQVANLAQSLEKLKQSNYWIVLADAGPGSESLERFEFPERCALVLGAEGSGASELIRNKSDYLVKIPLSGRIDSLNVSQAATVFFYAYRQQYRI